MSVFNKCFPFLHRYCKNNVKMPKGVIRSVMQRTDNTMTERKDQNDKSGRQNNTQ